MILEHLDRLLDSYMLLNKTFPEKIICNKITYDKIFEELKQYSYLDNCWYSNKKSYRGIIFEIKNLEGIELK